MSIVFPLPQGTYNSGSETVDQGVDIAAPGHTPLLAIASGTIVGHGIGGFGPWAPILKLDAPINGQSYVYYGHAGPGNQLPVGTHVSAGQTVGEVGAGIVGLSTGPHLEIGFSDARGTPVGPKGNPSAQLMHSLLGGGQTVSGPISGSGSGILGSGIGPNVGPDLNPIDALNSVLDATLQHAKYAALVVVLVVGGFILMSKGVRQTTHAEAAP